jgi:hypothetical protein
MKKRTNSKLKLVRETIRTLSASDVDRVHGGATGLASCAVSCGKSEKAEYTQTWTGALTPIKLG